MVSFMGPRMIDRRELSMKKEDTPQTLQGNHLQSIQCDASGSLRRLRSLFCSETSSESEGRGLAGLDQCISIYFHESRSDLDISTVTGKKSRS